ncbi:hypothetical protein CFHF_19685 [Caulobacter flavus]|uniref:Uncharacterized protein n=1 Tax=Caulobacter flavus TaxID=1679497 RepID=A0A2N5CNZ7_9CAUL|nr:hypothetical protein [Caulobacter flavus]AYV48605.1 hypothetical protein C1707_21380 [Caulobacter flavus]PLR08679.1 hypothetical protein CFHF_19685 [Caulobacter flavus]
MPALHNRPATASQAYWADRKAAFKLIKALETAIGYCRREPQFIAGPFDPQTGEAEVIENIAPWNAVADLQDEGRANPTVVEILTAQQRLDLLGG